MMRKMLNRAVALGLSLTLVSASLPPLQAAEQSPSSQTVFTSQALIQQAAGFVRPYGHARLRFIQFLTVGAWALLGSQRIQAQTPDFVSRIFHQSLWTWGISLGVMYLTARGSSRVIQRLIGKWNALDQEMIDETSGIFVSRAHGIMTLFSALFVLSLHAVFLEARIMARAGKISYWGFWDWLPDITLPFLVIQALMLVVALLTRFGVWSKAHSQTSKWLGSPLGMFIIHPVMATLLTTGAKILVPLLDPDPTELGHTFDIQDIAAYWTAGYLSLFFHEFFWNGWFRRTRDNVSQHMPLLLNRNIILGTILSMGVGMVCMIYEGAEGATSEIMLFVGLLGVPLTILLHEFSHAVAILLTTGQWPALAVMDHKERLMLGMKPKRLISEAAAKGVALAGPLSGFFGLVGLVALNSPYELLLGIGLPLLFINALALIWGDGELWRRKPVTVGISNADIEQLQDDAGLFGLTKNPSAEPAQLPQAFAARLAESRTYDQLFVLGQFFQRILNNAALLPGPKPEGYDEIIEVTREIVHQLEERGKIEKISDTHFQDLLMASKAALDALDRLISVPSEEALELGTHGNVSATYDARTHRIYLRIERQGENRTMGVPPSLRILEKLWIAQAPRIVGNAEETTYVSYLESRMKRTSLVLVIFMIILIPLLSILAFPELNQLFEYLQLHTPWASLASGFHSAGVMVAPSLLLGKGRMGSRVTHPGLLQAA